MPADLSRGMRDLFAHVQPLVPALRRYARALLRDRDLADDLVQDCLERVIMRWNRRRNEGDTRPWVFSIAHNLAVDYIRRQVRRGPHVAIEDVDEGEMAISEAQEASIRRNELLGFLDRLPEEQRSVILLVSVEDLSYSEAASVLGVPIGTVMSRLARGRGKLLRAMEGELIEEPQRAGLRRVK